MLANRDGRRPAEVRVAIVVRPWSTDYAKMSGAMLALTQACSRGVSMAPNNHDLAVRDIDASPLQAGQDARPGTGHARRHIASEANRQALCRLAQDAQHICRRLNTRAEVRMRVGIPHEGKRSCRRNSAAHNVRSGETHEGSSVV